MRRIAPVLAVVLVTGWVVSPLASADPAESPDPSSSSPTSTSASPTSTTASPTTSTTASPAVIATGTPSPVAQVQAAAAATVAVVTATPLTAVVGAPLTVSGRTTATDVIEAATEVYLTDHWSRSQLTTSIVGGEFSLPVTYGRTSAGTLTWRLRVVTSAGTIWSDAFTVTRLSTAPVLTSAPTSVYTSTTGAAQVTVANTGAGVSVWTEFWLSGRWSRSQVRTTDADGAAEIPLTYGWTTPGTYTWRVTSTNAYGVTSSTASQTLTRLSAPPVVVSAPSSVTTDVTGSVTARVAGVGAGVSVWTEFWVSGRWSRSQTRTTDSSGQVSIPLTYGWTTPGSYTWRVVTKRGTVDYGSAARTLKRVKPAPTSVPAVWTSCSPTLQGVKVSIGRTEHSRIIVNQTSGSYATVSYHFRDRTKACAFSTVYVETGRIGSAGTKAASARRAGDNSTPLGTYGITDAFGQLASPGTSMDYWRTSGYDYWVWDQSSAYFNTLRDKRMGGFNATKSERVWDYPSWYTYVLVIDFNRKPVVDRARGGGIRFHESNGQATGGCVSIGRTNLRTTVQKIIPGDKITIVA